MAKFILSLAALVAAAHACSTSFDCSLNGLCSAGACVCDSPWIGDACQTLQYAVTPASGKNLWTGVSDLNTWNGPIVTGADGIHQ